MASGVTPLPREPDTLIEMVLELRDEGMLETLRRALYGARSERFDTDPGQLALGLEDVSAAPVEPEPELAKAAVARWADPRQAGAQHRRLAKVSAA